MLILSRHCLANMPKSVHRIFVHARACFTCIFKYQKSLYCLVVKAAHKRHGWCCFVTSLAMDNDMLTLPVSWLLEKHLLGIFGDVTAIKHSLKCEDRQCCFIDVRDHHWKRSTLTCCCCLCWLEHYDREQIYALLWKLLFFFFPCFLFLHFSSHWKKKKWFPSDSCNGSGECKYVALTTLLWSPKLVWKILFFLLMPHHSPWMDKMSELCKGGGGSLPFARPVSRLNSATKSAAPAGPWCIDFRTGCRAFARPLHVHVTLHHTGRSARHVPLLCFTESPCLGTATGRSADFLSYYG